MTVSIISLRIIFSKLNFFNWVKWPANRVIVVQTMSHKIKSTDGNRSHWEIVWWYVMLTDCRSSSFVCDNEDSALLTDAMLHYWTLRSILCLDTFFLIDSATQLRKGDAPSRNLCRLRLLQSGERLLHVNWRNCSIQLGKAGLYSIYFESLNQKNRCKGYLILKGKRFKIACKRSIWFNTSSLPINNITFCQQSWGV